MAVFYPSGNITVKIFSGDHRTVAIQCHIAECIQFIQRFCLTGNHRREIHHLRQPQHMRMIFILQHLRQRKIRAVHITARQCRHTGADLNKLILLCLLRAAQKPLYPLLPHHIHNFMRITHYRRNPQRQCGAFKRNRGHHAGFNVQVRVDKSGYNHRIFTVNHLMCGGIFIHRADTGNHPPAYHYRTRKFPAVNQIQYPDIINTIIRRCLTACHSKECCHFFTAARAGVLIFLTVHHCPLFFSHIDNADSRCSLCPVRCTGIKVIPAATVTNYCGITG